MQQWPLTFMKFVNVRWHRVYFAAKFFLLSHKKKCFNLSHVSMCFELLIIIITTFTEQSCLYSWSNFGWISSENSGFPRHSDGFPRQKKQPIIICCEQAQEGLGGQAINIYEGGKLGAAVVQFGFKSFASAQADQSPKQSRDMKDSKITWAQSLVSKYQTQVH